MALDVASESPPKERREDRESTGPTGRIAHRAILEIGTRIDRLLVAMGRIRGRSDAPEWLLGELLGIGNDLAGTKQLRDSVSGFVTKRRHPLKRVGLDGLFQPDDRAAVDRVIPTAAASAIPQDEESRIAVPQ